MRARTIAAGLASQALILLLSGCSGGGGGAPSPSPSPTPTPTPTPPPVGGLDARPSNTTCLAGDAPSAVPYAVQEVYANLPNFTQPVAMLHEPGNDDRWYVVQKTGSVRVFDNTANVSTSSEFINIASRLNSDPSSSNDERGLLGMAFHPNYPTDPRVYLFYTGTDTSLGLVDRVSEFRTLNNGDTLSAGTEVELFNVDDPAGNHNGGNIAFGPDGHLYIGIGDGGGGNDQFGSIGNGQRLTTLLGKMLRIDVATQGTYSIPASNPFASGNPRCNVSGTSPGAGMTNCPEIYAYGFRNPWRWSFDRVSGELWLNDVGQGALEEVDRVVLGGNYGWRCFEGTTDTGMACGANKSVSIPPVAQYGRTLGQSTTGGFVYRGSAIAGLNGRYVFADFASGNIWHIARDTAPTLTLTTSDMLDTSLLVSSFAEDMDGELYVVNLSGTLHKIIPAAQGGGRVIATELSDTGCVNAANPTQPATGLIPYAPNAPFFSDDASKTRWLALPNGERISISADDFNFPNGSVLVKNFTLGGNLIETRLFMRHNNGAWAGYTYEWNAQQTEATRVIGGKTVQVAGQTWQFPSEDQCLQCHTQAAGRTLGLEIGQLNGDFGYPTGRTANQLVTLGAIGTLAVVLDPPAQLPVIPNPAGSAALAQRARAYLHANCGYCHRPGGTTPTSLDLRFTTALNATNACNVAPTLSGLGITNPLIIAPGSATRSVVVARMNRTGADAMPPLGRHVIDDDGVQLITDWINGLGSCN